MASLSDELRILANHVEGVEAMYPEEAPGCPAEPLAAVYELARELGVLCYQLKKAKVT